MKVAERGPRFDVLSISPPLKPSASPDTAERLRTIYLISQKNRKEEKKKRGIAENSH